MAGTIMNTRNTTKAITTAETSSVNKSSTDKGLTDKISTEEGSTDKSSIITVQGFSRGTPETLVRAGEFQFLIDEPAGFGGGNKAPSPVAYLLGAIAGCVTAIGVQAAKELGVAITKLNPTVTGKINSESFLGISRSERSGFSEIAISLDLESDAGADQLIQWEKAVRERCPVIDNLLFETRVNIVLPSPVESTRQQQLKAAADEEIYFLI